MNAPRWLAGVGWTGAALTVVVLAATVLMRLGTRLGADGAAVSMLPPDLEFWARVAHRAAAGIVGVLAAFALVVVARGGTALAPWRAPVAWVVGLTVLLALVGRYTPGYRHDIVTVVNVAGGVALAAAFLHLAAASHPRPAGAPLAIAALLVLLTLAATGAASDAAAMRGVRSFGPLHLGLGALFSAFALAAAWRGRHRPALAAGVAVLSLAQAGLGLYLIRVTLQRPIEAVWVHSMAAVVLALLLVRLASAVGCEPAPPAAAAVRLA